MALLRAAALCSLILLCGCRPFTFPAFVFGQVESRSKTKDEHRAAEYYLVVTRDELSERSDIRVDALLEEEAASRGTFRPFADSGFEVTVRKWDSVEQKVSLSVCAAGNQPVELEMLFRERRILHMGDKKYHLGLVRKWRYEDGSLEFDLVDAIR